MPGVEFSDLVSHMRKNGIAVDDGETIEYDDKYHEAKEIILSEGAALPEILCDVLLIGKNRAERIFDQFERDGIVSPKDENGKRKIIKS
jgi:DNA segregation ATPase FtsK/SpoIIIE-like protein